MPSGRIICIYRKLWHGTGLFVVVFVHPFDNMFRYRQAVFFGVKKFHFILAFPFVVKAISIFSDSFFRKNEFLSDI